MKDRVRKDTILYVRIQKENMDWIRSRVSSKGFHKTRGLSSCVDDLISSMRHDKRRMGKGAQA